MAHAELNMEYMRTPTTEIKRGISTTNIGAAAVLRDTNFVKGTSNA